MKPMPHRQIHMDFHTSPMIPGIGAAFDADAFGKTLSDARVQHVNLFGKCHHGWFYYPSKVGPMHPNLSFDLLGAQTEACEKYGISYSIYTCVGWNEDFATRHPEWQEVSPEGLIGAKPPFERKFYQWQKLCLNNPEYREVIKAELKEEYERFHPEGFWIDIILQNECVCHACQEKAKVQGFDIQSAADRRKMARLAQIDYMRDIYAFVMMLEPELHVYFNGYPYAYDLNDEQEYSNANKRACVTFMDIESLPSTEWGYSHFPIAVNYVNKYSAHDVIMMNGKFHLAWGDFGSLRNLAALEYECYRAVANGAGICVGDQLHPSGALDASVYKRIGQVFSQIEATEPWCRGSKKIAQIGVFGTVRSTQAITNGVDLSIEGTYRVLTELKYQFDIVDLTDSIEEYELLILPDRVTLTPEAARRIDAYVEKGGKLLVTGHSAAGPDGFMLDCLPVEYLGEGLTTPRYMDIREGAFENVPAMKTVAYSGGARVSLKKGAKALCDTVDSYFDRSEAQFCSHRQTPPKLESDGEPCVVLSDRVGYVSNMLFMDLAEYGVKVYKDIIGSLIRRLLPCPLIRDDLPAYAEVTLRALGENTVVHVLNYIVQRKCKQLDTVEDVVPLSGRTLEVRLDHAPSSVKLLPGGETVPFEYENGYVRLKPETLGGRTLFLLEA